MPTGPAALTTSGVAMRPALVCTWCTRPPDKSDPRHLGAAHNLDAALLRRARESHRHAIGIGDPVASAEGRGENAVHGDAWRASRGVCRCEPVDVDAVRPLQLHVPLECRDALVTRQQKEIAVRPEVDRRADGLLEVGEERDRFLRELDVGRVRELMSKSAGVASGGHRPELRLALDQDDVA